jgi:hypothetical protein
MRHFSVFSDGLPGPTMDSTGPPEQTKKGPGQAGPMIRLDEPEN